VKQKSREAGTTEKQESKKNPKPYQIYIYK
jgi:hypothetical protein